MDGRIGPDLLNSFQNYLSVIDKLDFNVDGSFKTNVTEYWPFASRVIASQQSMPVRIYLDTSPYSGRAVLNKSVDSICLQCGMNADEFPPELLASPILLKAIVAPTELSEHNVQSFRLNFMSTYRRATFYGLRLEVLKSVLKCFKNLNDFDLHIETSYLAPNFRVKVASEEKDENGQYVYPLTSLLHQPNSPSDELAYTILQGVESTEEITFCLNFFPNTKHLKILHCELNLDRQFNTTLELNDLKLQKLVVNITSLVYQGGTLSTTSLQIEEKEANRISCFKWKRENLNI